MTALEQAEQMQARLVLLLEFIPWVTQCANGPCFFRDAARAFLSDFAAGHHSWCVEGGNVSVRGL